MTRKRSLLALIALIVLTACAMPPGTSGDPGASAERGGGSGARAPRKGPGGGAVISGYWAAIFALLTAYVGLFGQALGVKREFSGWMSKPWRMVVLHVGAWITLGLDLDIITEIFAGEISPIFRLGVRHCGLGCLQTVWVRLSRILRALGEKDGR